MLKIRSVAQTLQKINLT